VYFQNGYKFKYETSKTALKLVKFTQRGSISFVLVSNSSNARRNCHSSQLSVKFALEILARAEASEICTAGLTHIPIGRGRIE
jgi:ribonucleotide monophosphatase NagD (HAD superfamily)